MKLGRHPPTYAGLLAASALAASGSAGAPHIGTWGLDLEAMNTDVRPQDDFFRFANGAWLDAFEIPEDLPGYGSFIDLFIQSEEKVQLIIEEVAGDRPAPGTDARKIADLYNDYLDRETIEEKGLVPLEADMAAIRAVETHADVARLLAIIKLSPDARVRTAIRCTRVSLDSEKALWIW